MQRATIDPIRQGFDTQGLPGEQSLNQAGVWKRSRNDWELGGGQREADTVQSQDRQFYQSTGVDVWTKNELTLLPKVGEKRDDSATNQLMATAYDGTNYYIYVTDGDQVYSSTDIGATWNDWTETSVNPSTITGIASDGKYAYVCSSTAIYRIYQNEVGADVLDGTNRYWSLTNVDGVWVANGYLIASANERLVTVPTGEAISTDHDITPATFNQVETWTSVIGTPVGIFAAGYKGSQSRVYYIGINDSTGGLLPPVIAAELPVGETANVLSYYGGLVCIGTSRGIRLATINGAGYLSYGPVVEISGGVSLFETQGEFIWFNWDNYESPFDATSRTGLGRLGLSEFTETLVPAYASDLMATTTGVIQGIVTTSDNRRMFSVSSGGVYLENASDEAKELTGTIDEGRFRWGITELKAAVSVDLRHNSLAAGESVVVKVVDDSDVTTTIVTSDTDATVTPGLKSISSVTGEWLSPQITLTQTATDGSTPTLKRWTLRAIPMPYAAEVIALPIILTTQTHYDRRDIYQDTLSEYQYLKSLLEDRSLVTFEMGGESSTVYVAGLSYQPGDVAKWSDDNDWFEGVLTVQVVTVQGT